ncbi:unnamed protein product, partial [Phaeothamnion confervicola]
DNPFTCASGASSCPDSGQQELSEGGRVRAVVYMATNLPNRDYFSASGVSDPYVAITVDGSTFKTTTRRNTLNPIWSEDLDLGVHTSGTPLVVAINDADSGLERGDDLLASATISVPYCSALQADSEGFQCGGDFGRDCDTLGTAWALPVQPRCNETAWLNLGGDGNSTDCALLYGSATCLLIGFVIVPFQIEIAATHYGADVTVTVAGKDTTVTAAAYAEYGKLYNDRTLVLDSTETLFDSLRGGLLLSVGDAYAGVNAAGVAAVGGASGAGGAAYVTFALNMPATVYLCRWQQDYAAYGNPPWLAAGDWRASPSRAYLDGYTAQDEYFRCWSKHYAAHSRDYYGGLTAAAATLYSNGVDGREAHMYMVVAVPDTGSSYTGSSGGYDGLTVSAFWKRLGEHLPALLFFAWMAARYLAAADHRTDRVESHVLSRAAGKGLRSPAAAAAAASAAAAAAALFGGGGNDDNEAGGGGRGSSGGNKDDAATAAAATAAREMNAAAEARPTALQALFLSHGRTPRNVAFRRHLYFAAAATRLSLLLPLLTLWSWGATAAATVEPRALGFCLVLVGTAAALCWHALRLWRGRGWLMSGEALACLAAAAAAVAAFLAAVLFVDPAARGGGDLDLAGLTALFLTLSMLPLVLLLFANDAKL